jgi:hypothetical protein
LAITSPTSGGRSVSIVGLWTKATEFVFCLFELGHEKLPTKHFSNSLFMSHAVICCYVTLAIENAFKETKKE